MRSGEVSTRLKIGSTGVAFAHPHRRKDTLLDEIAPLLPAYRCDDLSRDHVQQIVVSILAAETGLRLYVTQLGDDFVARVAGWRKKQQVASSQAQAATMREEIANCHLVGDVRIVHLKARKTVHHAIVPTEFALIHQNSERRCGERFGV